MMHWILLLASVTSSTAHPVTGQWILASSRTEADQRIHDATQRALSSWPSFAVALATRELVAENTPCPRYDLRVTEDAMQLSCAGSPTLTIQHGQTVRFQDPKDRTIAAQVQVKPQRLRLTWSAPDGRRTDTLTVEDATLHMASKVTAPMLPQAIRWTQTYIRDTPNPSPREARATQPNDGP